MKKSTKKALSLLLAVTMVVGLLTGCGSTKFSDGGMSYLILKPNKTLWFY